MCNANDPDLPKYLYQMLLYQHSNLCDNTLVQEVIIHFKNNNSLITRSSVYQDKRFFYEKFFHYSDLSYDNWQQHLFTEQKQVLDIMDVNYNYLNTKSFTINYYYPSLSTPTMVISFIIPTQHMLSAIMTDEIKNSGNIELTYGANQDSIHITHNSDLSVTDLVTLNTLQPPLNLKVGLSKTAYSEAMSPVKATLMIYILSSVFTAIILSVLFTYINMKPLTAVISKISQMDINTVKYEGNAYSFILQTITGISQSDEQHKKAYTLAQNSLEVTVFSMAMKGLLVDSQHLFTALSAVPAFKGTYVLAGISKEPLGNDWPTHFDPDVMMVIAQRFLLRNANKPYLCLLDDLYVAVNIDLEGGEQQINGLINDLHKTLSDEFGVNACIGVSQKVSSIEQLTEAADQVAYCLLSAHYGIYPSIVWHDCISAVAPEEIPINEELFYLSLTQDEGKSDKTYFDILLNNVCSEYNSALYAKTIYYKVMAICQKALSLAPSNKDIILREYDTHASIRSNMYFLRDICRKIHETVNVGKTSHKQELINEVLGYIQTNYASPNLSLTTIAGYFSLSERYLSSLIREQTGKSYADYIIDIRISEARRLLLQTDIPINDIAVQVGYELPNSFYKTFKNCTGLSPRQYRAEHC
jgi:AraC-like DNA-binding protein/intracellular sulfur oxidation DsrE/DsrF family protein